MPTVPGSQTSATTAIHVGTLPAQYDSQWSLGPLAPQSGVITFDTDPVSGGSPFGPGRIAIVGTGQTSGGFPVRVFDFNSIYIGRDARIVSVGPGPLILTSASGAYVEGVIDVSGGAGHRNADGGGGGGGGGGALALLANGPLSVAAAGRVLASGGDGGQGVTGPGNGEGGAPGVGGGDGGRGGDPVAGGAGGAGGGAGRSLGTGGGGGGGGASGGPGGAGGSGTTANSSGWPGGPGAPGACPATVDGGPGGNGGGGGGIGGRGGQAPGGAGAAGTNSVAFLAGGAGGGGGATSGGGGGKGGDGGFGSGGGGGAADACAGGAPGVPGKGGSGGCGGHPLWRGRDGSSPGSGPTGGAGRGGAIVLGSAAGIVRVDGSVSAAGGNSDEVPGADGGTGPVIIYGDLAGNGHIDGELYPLIGEVASTWVVTGGAGGGGAGGPGLLDAASDAPAPALPTRTGLHANVPNPFNPSTAIHFEVARRERVVLQLFDIRGRLVRTLLDKELEAMHHELRWNGTDEQGHDVAAGVYLCRLHAGSVVDSRWLTLVK